MIKEFTTGNYGIKTTSQIEYYFVDDKYEDPVNKWRRETGDWPKEDEEKLKQQKKENEKARPRKMQLLCYFDKMREKYAYKLTGVGALPLTDAEFIVCRLYTGPMRVPMPGSNSAPLPLSFAP